MFKLGIKLFFFWRRNHAPSIVFKMCVFAALAWLVFSAFAEPATAGIAAGAGAVLALLKYGLQARRENAKLLEYVGGDREKLAALKAKFGKDAAAGGLMMEMLRAEMEDEEYADEEELTEEQMQENRESAEALLSELLAVIDDAGVEIPDREERLADVREGFEDGYDVPSRHTMVGTLMTHCSFNFGFDDFCNDDDHAGLVEELAEATQGAWKPEEVNSSFDEENDRWVVSFQDQGQSVSWRFTQSGDHLSENFIKQLFDHCQKQTGMKIVTVDSEDWFEGLVLPADLAGRLLSDDT